MKRIAVFIMAALLFPLFSCYLNTTDKSRVSLKTTPKPDVTALHVAVYDGVPAEENLLLYQVFLPETPVDLEVPTGEDRIFVIWAETIPGIARYYGKSSPVDIGSDDSEVVTLSMSDMTIVSVFNIRADGGSKTIWNTIYGTDNYELWYRGSVKKQELLYYGPNTYYNDEYLPNIYGLKVHSSLFNLSSPQVIGL